MRGRRVFLAAVYALFQLQIAGCFSGDHERFVPAHHRWPFLERSLDQGAGARHRGPFHSLSPAREGRLRPSAVLRSHFRRAPGAQGISLLARPDHQVEVENAPVSAKHIVTVRVASPGQPATAQKAPARGGNAVCSSGNAVCSSGNAPVFQKYTSALTQERNTALEYFHEGRSCRGAHSSSAFRRS